MIRGLGLVMILALAGLSFSCNSGQNGLDGISLSDELASPEAKVLYSKLQRLSQKGVMVGHQDDLAYGVGWRGDSLRSDINDVSGDFPAVFGWDLGHIGALVNIDSVPFEQMKYWALAMHKKGGINTYSWHPLNMVTGGSSWDTNMTLAEILPGGAYHNKLLEQLDKVADFFSQLKDSRGQIIPVIFRPWHEMNGAWFWWGTNSGSPDEYKALYRFTVDYLRNKKNQHQILYAFSPDVFESAGEYLSYYPGDAYVDILGIDDYKGIRSVETNSQTINRLTILKNLAQEKGKLYTLSETGVELIPDSNWFTQVLLPVLQHEPLQPKPCWVLFWRNGRPDHFFAPYPGHASVPDFLEFKNDSLTFFLTDINSLVP